MAQFESYDAAIKAFHNLVELRYLRDIKRRQEAQQLRKKDSNGRIWKSGHYRPTYTMEATADLSTALDITKDKSVKVFWDGLWWRGDESNWSGKVSHLDMKRFGTREKFVVLDELRAGALQ